MQNRRTPVMLFAVAALCLACAGQVAAQKTCKPRVDKNNLAVELTSPDFNGGERIVLTMPAKIRETRAFGDLASDSSAANHASPVSYSVVIAEKRDNGVTLDLNVSVLNKNGAYQVTKRTLILPFETIVEQRYLTGVQVKAYFKLRPFSCKAL